MVFLKNKLPQSLLLLVGMLHASAFFAQDNSTYRRPPADVATIAESRPTPQVSMNPTRDALLLTDYNPNPSIATLAEPFLKLGGIRVNPRINARQRITEYAACTVQWFKEGKDVVVEMPETGQMVGIPAWSPNGKMMAFAVDVADGVQLWVADARSGKSNRLGAFYLNDVLGTPFSWMEDSERILVRSVPARGPAPDANVVPTGPAIEETSGKVSQIMTYQDLLKNGQDEVLFEFYGSSQLLVVQVKSAKFQLLGKPGLYMSVNASPDENYWLVTQLLRPFSYRVMYQNFARKTAVWDKDGQSLHSIAEYPVTDEIPRQGTVEGPRAIEWQLMQNASLVWMEALDGGDPKRKAAFRDKIMVLDAPFTAQARELMKTQDRCVGFDWLANPNACLMAEYDRDRRWSTTYYLPLDNPDAKTMLFDLSVNDDYNNPGDPVYERQSNGEWVVAQDGDWLFFKAEGASENGQYPRLDKINLKTREKTTLFQSADQTLEEFIAFADANRTQIVTRYQSKTEVPNFFLVNLRNKSRSPLTDFKDPAPQLTGINKQVVKYTRPDGVPLSGTLYLPADYKEGQKLPLFIWAYPLEYSDKSTAGQVRATDNNFTFYRNDSPIFFVTQGYAVLMNATIPIVGDPETMNDTFREQATASGRAAIDYLDSLGIIDRTKVGVGGHSYGAFMTANLLAHSDDYAYGIARSGAYNRSLTPFGFQSERRSFWEAKDIYMNVSPFNFADKIKKPLLLIHGEADNNPGTYTIQSERLYQAIKGTGGTARLVLLPHESHGYRARESVLHVLAEMFDWAGKYAGPLKP